MTDRILRIHPGDNAIVALNDLHKGELVSWQGSSWTLCSEIPAKHKFSASPLSPGDPIILYGIQVGAAAEPIALGQLLTTRNVRHQTAQVQRRSREYAWKAPDVSRWRERTFLGYRREDGQVGTRNYWLVVPLVFCENRNIQILKQAFEEELGFALPQAHRRQVAELVRLYRSGGLSEGVFVPAPDSPGAIPEPRRVFPHIDGIKFLTHTGGCGGTREDSETLCGLIAGYIHHPNVAGATILSLGCQNAQTEILERAIHSRNSHFRKPLILLDQQQSGTEFAMLSEAVRQTFLGLVQADACRRAPAPLSQLNIALKCGGSDGFSGISANPAVGHLADIVATLGGKTILAEFPELCGVEQNLIDRCVQDEDAERFIRLMNAYSAQARAAGSGFDMNPSPGNIRDGLITDAMKSAGAAKKGGAAPVSAVLDYPEYAARNGLHLLCTPGNDVEAVTAQVGAGANIVLFTTGLGTPTGNPVSPVVKISTNSPLAARMHDIIDVDAGPILTGEKSVEEMGGDILDFVITVASGERRTKAELLCQDDFIPWKRGISL